MSPNQWLESARFCFIYAEASSSPEALYRTVVSRAYYAVFHAIIHESIAYLLGTSDVDYNSRLGRKHTHRIVRDVSTKFIREKATDADHNHLLDLYKTFNYLYDQRQNADYDLKKLFALAEAERCLKMASGAMRVLQEEKESPAFKGYAQELLLSHVGKG